MPLPTPKEGEEENDFISRCMSNNTMKEEFPDQEQRNAVCYRQYRKNKSNSKMLRKDNSCINFVSKHYEVEKESGDKERYIEVPVSGTGEDRDGERMSQKAVNQIIEALKSGVILHSNHGTQTLLGGSEYSWKDITGVSVDGYEEDGLVIAKFRLNKAHPDHEYLWKYVHDERMPVGFSIGARVKEGGYHYEEEDDEEQKSIKGYTEGDSWYAISPNETSDDKPKYPINNCSDVKDAWNLRGRGDYSISKEELEKRIQNRAKELNCEVPKNENE